MSPAPRQQQMAEEEHWDWTPFVNQSPPTVYNPPQLELDGTSFWPCGFCNIFTQFSDVCARPVFPCCCVRCVGCLCASYTGDAVNIADADAWLTRMLNSGANPNCPEHLRGVWWMSDNQGNAETVVTLQHADWEPDGMRAILRIDLNWARTATCCGQFNNVSVGMRKPVFHVETSPDGEWMKLEHYLIYVPAARRGFTWPDGSNVEMEPGDMMRVDFKVREDPTSGVGYQYIVRRVAYLDEQGALVKTPNWFRLMRCVTYGESRLQSSCCNYFLCGEDRKNGKLNYTAINPTLHLRFPGAVA